MNEQNRDNITFTKLSITELKALYRILEHEYIKYDDMEAMSVVRMIRRILEEHELERT